MREIRTSGSEGGGLGVTTESPYPYPRCTTFPDDARAGRSPALPVALQSRRRGCRPGGLRSCDWRVL
jgi:hypothetical protein